MWVNSELASSALLVVGIVGLLCATFAQLMAHRKLWLARRSGHEAIASASLPPITVLKPLKGLDDGLYENLASIASQDYPEMEIVFGVEDPNDPALGVVLRVRRDFPHVPIRVVARPGRNALNPKISNLLNMLEVASHDCLLISDSNVRVGPGYLRAIAADLSKPSVGLVSNLIVGRGEISTGAALENLHLCSFIVAGVCFGDALGHPIVIGKSMLLRKSELDRVGGLASMADTMAEDYMLGQAYDAARMRVVLSAHAVDTFNRESDVHSFLARHQRWAQLRRWGAPGSFVAELLLYPVPWLLLALAFAGLREGPLEPLSAQLALGGIACKTLADYVLVWDVRRERPDFRMAWLVPLRDCLLLGLWCGAFARRTIVWRGNRRRIGRGTVLTPLPTAATYAGPAAREEAREPSAWGPTPTRGSLRSL